MKPMSRFDPRLEDTAWSSFIQFTQIAIPLNKKASLRAFFWADLSILGYFVVSVYFSPNIEGDIYLFEFL